MNDGPRDLTRRELVLGISAMVAALVDGCAPEATSSTSAGQGGSAQPQATSAPTTTEAPIVETASGVTSQTAATADPLDGLTQPRLRHTGLMRSDASGILYAVAPNLDLKWWQHRPDRRTNSGSTMRWADGSGSSIGTGWDFQSITSLGFGILIALDDAGDVFWYRDLARSGTIAWAQQTGRKIGSGWTADHLVGLPRGHVLAFESTGEVIWHRWSSGGWHPESGSAIARSWDAGGSLVAAFSGGGGLVYSIDDRGALAARALTIPEDDLGSGPANGSTISVQRVQHLGLGWDAYRVVCSTGNGAIYTVDNDNVLRMHQHDLDGTWIEREGFVLENNFDATDLVASDPVSLAPPEDSPVDAYWRHQSLEAGASAGLAISTTVESVSVSLVRLTNQKSGEPTAEHTGVDSVLVGHNQGLEPHAWREGCNWAVEEIDVPSTLTSGLYAARIRAADTVRVVPLIIRPSEPVARVAVLANTNTWRAYNPWCGINQYTDPYGVRLSFATPNPGLDPYARIIDGDGNEESPTIVFDHHLVAGELEILGWMDRAGFDFDLYADTDFHDGIVGFDRYAALVLTTHPEYWTVEMVDRLTTYLDGGGSLLYLGGNGLYERVEFDDDNRTLVLRRGDPEGNRDLMRFNDRPERSILGVAFEGISDPSDPPALQRGNAYGSFAPYRVAMAEHRFFAGTRLSDGDAFVTVDGVAGGVGWEIDTSFDDALPTSAGPSPVGLDVLAVGMLGERSGEQGSWTPDYNAHMTAYDHPGGGAVFSVGSLVFGHWMVQDERAQQVVTNVLNEALAKR